MQLNKTTISLLAVFCAFLWGSAFVLAKETFHYLLPLRVSAYRFMIAGVLLFIVLLFKKYDFKLIKEHIWFYILLGFVQCVGQYGMFFWGLNYAPSAISSIIVGSMPLFVAVLATIFIKSDTMNIRKFISIILGVIGVVVIALDDNVSLEEYPYFYVGIGLLVFSNIAAAMSNIMVAKYNKNFSIIAMASVSCFIGGLMLYVLSYIFEPENTKFITEYPLSFIVEIFLLGLIPTITLSLWFYLVKLPGVVLSDLNIWKFLIPVFGVMSSWLFLSNEHVDMYEILGIVFISSSIIVLNAKLPKKKLK